MAETSQPDNSTGPDPRGLMCRLPRALHCELQALAAETGLSMNEFMVYACESFISGARQRPIEQIASEVLTRRAERRKRK